MYEKIEHIPYRTHDIAARVIGLEMGLQTPGFYEYFTSQPGYLVPLAHHLAPIVGELPERLSSVYLGQTIWQWLGLFILVVLLVLGSMGTYLLFRRFAKQGGQPWDDWLMIVPPILIAMASLFVVDYADRDLRITGAIFLAVRTSGNTIVMAMTAWAVFGACTAVAETIIASPRVTEGSVDATLWRIVSRVVGVFLGAWIIIEGAQDLGADMIPVIAGLGVGGLAVALAAQRTFANFIGSVMLLTNKPVRVGDFCRYGDQIGTVESIGLISTRIRSLERTIVTVPNAEFSEMQLDNFSVRDERLLKAVLQLRYETTPDQLRFVLAKLREVMLAHPMVTPEPARVRFIALGTYSLDVEIFAYLRCQDQDTFLAIKEDLLLRIVDIVKDAGTDFAFPSQTAYLARDGGLDTERGDTAAREVAKWRAGGRLPFPDFEDAERARLEDSLRYPPKGSPHDRGGAPTEPAAGLS